MVPSIVTDPPVQVDVLLAVGAPEKMVVFSVIPAAVRSAAPLNQR